MKNHYKLLALISSLVLSAHHADSQQQASNQDFKQLPKIGLAPHDRPACQLPPLTAQRQRPQAGQNPKQLDLQVANQSSTKQQQQPEAPTTVISSPNILTLNSNQQNSTLPANPSQLVRGRVNARKFDSSERLRQLRQLLTSNNYDAYLVTPNDEHGSEYVADYDRRLKFISGFTGSNGFALILLDRAVLFTDGRYALQADLDLDCNWWLVVSDEPMMDIPMWLKANAAKGIKVATDARLMPLQEFDYLDSEFKKLDCEFALISHDLIDVVWNNVNSDYSDSDSPNPSRFPPSEPLFVHPIQFAGNVSWEEKLVRLADEMGRLRAKNYLISQLDEIAWLLNLRGADIPMSPLFKAYLLVTVAQQQNLVPMKQQLSNTATTLSIEQLLSQQQQQQQQAPALQAPQVTQIQASQVIRATLYVDLRKIQDNQQVGEHLHLNSQNGSLYYHHHHKQQPAAAGEPNSGPVTSRIKVELKDYNVFIMDIRDKLQPSTAATSGGGPASVQLQGKLLLNSQANVAIHVLAKSYEDRLILTESLVNKMKAVKTEQEVQGMRLAHWRDSLAISMLLSQLELDIELGQKLNKWTEMGAANELELYRSLMDFNRGQSFPSISAYGSNGAIIHYEPKASLSNEFSLGTIIKNQSTYLLDCGGQYLDGTTDITRTVHFGRPSEFQREIYTRVLMGAIDMMSVIFDAPNRMRPFKLQDLIARRHLLEIGLDYQHGTGHGIGLYSMVHEAPWLIEHYTSSQAAKQKHGSPVSLGGTAASSPLVVSDPQPIQANMFTSIEPGFYKANDFGVRLENIVVTQQMRVNQQAQRQNDRHEFSGESKQQAQLKFATKSGESNQVDSGKQLLRFEPISLVPFEPKLIKFELLSNKQKTWLNSFNLMVRMRMTQQINYYLTKIKEAPTANRSLDNSLGYYNFLSMAGDQLQEKLERTHKWIMAKTELIPLDVPQYMFGAGGGALARRAASAQAAPAQQASVDLNQNKRLILTYMSSLPYNDREAFEALEALDEQEEEELNGRIDGKVRNNTLAQNSSKQQHACAGLQCDLMLLGAINHKQLISNHQTLDGKSTSPYKRTNWFDDDQDDPSSAASDQFLAASGERKFSSSKSLIDSLFQLNSAGNGPHSSHFGTLFSLNMLTVFIISLLFVLQLSVLSYMCKTRRKLNQRHQIGASARSRCRRPLESDPVSLIATGPSAAVVSQQPMQQQQLQLQEEQQVQLQVVV